MANAYETGQRKAIPAVLVYPRFGDDVLMLHRNVKERDFHAGKWNGLGGKCEPDESPLEAAARELREESGLDLDPKAFRPLGILQFPNFKPGPAEDWLVFVFSAAVTSKELKSPVGPEGTLEWVPLDKLLGLNLWAGDKEFLPLVLEERPFIGSFWYQGGDLVRHWLRPF